MTARLLLLSVLFFVLFTLSRISPCWATVVTFDDLSETATGSFLANGYQGLVWSKFHCFNAILATNSPNVGVSGYYYGMVSTSNVVYNSFADTAEIDSPGTNFNFLSAYLTGAWNSNLNTEVQGFRGVNLLYDTTVVAGATSPTLFTFDYADIDRLTFSSFGGQDAGLGNGGTHFVMDNLAFEFIPEPSSFLLTAAGALTLWTVVRRTRASR